MNNIYRLLDRTGLTATRSQLMLSNALLIVLVLGIAGMGTYQALMPLLQTNMQHFMEDYAQQLNGKLEAMNKQVEAIALQAVMDTQVQSALLHVAGGNELSSQEKLELGLGMIKYLAYEPMIYSIELFTNEETPLFPLENRPMRSYVSGNTLRMVNETSGRFIWTGADPYDYTRIVGIRRILEYTNNQHAIGYELVKIDRAYMESFFVRSNNQQHPSYIYDQTNKLIMGNRNQKVDLRDLSNGVPFELEKTVYIPFVQFIPSTDWTMVILIPQKQINEPVEIMRGALLGAGIIGFIIAFLLSVLVSAWITRSIYTVRKVMREVRNGRLITNNRLYLNREANELNLSYNKMVSDIQNLINAVYEKELAQAQAELRALQARIQPHFLYNTLEAMNWMLRDREEHEVADHLLGLSGLFRYCIMDSEWVTLREEIEHINSYMSLIQLRMGKKMLWSVEMPESFASCVIPKLLLQPVIENAVLHGIEPRIGGGAITLKIQEMGTGIQIQIEDTGIGIAEEKLLDLLSSISQEKEATGRPAAIEKGGIGLRNVNMRILGFYGAPYGITLDSSPGRGTRVSISIPKINRYPDPSTPLLPSSSRILNSGGHGL